MIQLRHVTREDARTLWLWRNDDLTRRMSIHTDPVPWADHCAWLEGILNHTTRHLLIGVLNGADVGTVRLDQEGTRATVNITVAPEHRGRGVGLNLLLALAQHAQGQGLAGLNAVIRADNQASIRIFTKAGYRHDHDEGDVGHYRYEIDRS